MFFACWCRVCKWKETRIFKCNQMHQLTFLNILYFFHISIIEELNDIRKIFSLLHCWWGESICFVYILQVCFILMLSFQKVKASWKYTPVFNSCKPRFLVRGSRNGGTRVPSFFHFFNRIIFLTIFLLVWAVRYWCSTICSVGNILIIEHWIHSALSLFRKKHSMRKRGSVKSQDMIVLR